MRSLYSTHVGVFCPHSSHLSGGIDTACHFFSLSPATDFGVGPIDLYRHGLLTTRLGALFSFVGTDWTGTGLVMYDFPSRPAAWMVVRPFFVIPNFEIYQTDGGSDGGAGRENGDNRKKRLEAFTPIPWKIQRHQAQPKSSSFAL